MKYVLIVQSEELAKKDAPPFISESKVMEGLWGVEVFGPYNSLSEASKAFRTFPSKGWNLKIVPLNSLSEELENPYATIWWGDSPR